MQRITVQLSPRLIVRGADAAIAFYQRAFGAELLERYEDDRGSVVHAALQLGQFVFSLTEERPEWGQSAPSNSDTAHVLLHLTVPDPDALCTAAVEGGADVLIPIDDRPYGKREGRLRDPFGHFWILSRPLQ